MDSEFDMTQFVIRTSIVIVFFFFLRGTNGDKSRLSTSFGPREAIVKTTLFSKEQYPLTFSCTFNQTF